MDATVQVLSELQRPASAATEPGCPWHATAAPADLAALQAAAAAGLAPAADNWQLWGQSRLARSLVREEVSASSNPGALRITILACSILLLLIVGRPRAI